MNVITNNPKVKEKIGKKSSIHFVKGEYRDVLDEVKDRLLKNTFAYSLIH